LIERLQQHRVLSAQQNVLSASLKKSRNRLFSDQISFIEEIFCVWSIMINEINENFFVLIVDEAVKKPFVEAVEVDLTARLETLNKEAFHIVIVDCRVFIVKQSEKVRASRDSASRRRRWMNFQELCDMNQNSSKIFRVYRQFKKRFNLLRVNHIAIIVHELDNTIAESFEDETFDDETLRERIF
jgi:hypothetical protein